MLMRQPRSTTLSKKPVNRRGRSTVSATASKTTTSNNTVHLTSREVVQVVQVMVAETNKAAVALMTTTSPTFKR